MEKWTEFKKGQISSDDYSVVLQAGEEKGLLVFLRGEKHEIRLDFGSVQAFRMLEEGLVQFDIYSEDELERFRYNQFENVIYELSEGKFSSDLQTISQGYSDLLELRHFVIVTPNYILDILSLDEPHISIIS